MWDDLFHFSTHTLIKKTLFLQHKKAGAIFVPHCVI